MFSQGQDSSRLAIVLSPRDVIGGELERFAADWIREGILSDFIWVPTQGIAAEDIRKLKLNCSFASKLEGRQGFDLFQYLSQVVIDHLDVIVPWVVGDGQPDDELWRVATALRAALKEGMPNGGTGASVRSKWLYTSLLVMPTTERAQLGFEPTQGEYGEFDLNVYVSPETRSNPWAGSAPLLAGEDFELFSLAQIASVAGVWAGETESLSGLLARDGYRFGQGSFVMLRTMASMVVTNGLADRLVSESLQLLSDPAKSPYEFSDPNDLNRPIARADELPLVKEQIQTRLEKVLRAGGDELTYTSERKPEALDFTRDWKDAIRFFWQFTRDSIKAMPRYSLDWLKNEWTRLLGRKLNDVRDAVPERFIGITAELQQMLKDIEGFRNDHGAQDALVISTTADSKNPKIWSTLRSVSFGALDGSDSPQGEKPIVLPKVDYVVHDPAARFEVPLGFQEEFDLEVGQVDYEQASDLKHRVALAISEQIEHIDQLNAAIAQTKATLLDPFLDLPMQTGPEPEPEAEPEPEIASEPESEAERVGEADPTAAFETQSESATTEAAEPSPEVPVHTPEESENAEVDSPEELENDDTVLSEELAIPATPPLLVWNEDPDVPSSKLSDNVSPETSKKNAFKRPLRKPRQVVDDE